jgi:hypothetical protein
MKKPLIHIENCQIKSLEKAKKLAYALNIIEEECGIKVCEISLNNMFVCPWIDINKLNDTPMERLLRDILSKLKST